MVPIKFEGHNKVYAANQPQYKPLPAYVLLDGEAVFCWKLTWRERLKLLFFGKLWHEVLTFNKPLQPQLLLVDCPLISDKEEKTEIPSLQLPDGRTL